MITCIYILDICIYTYIRYIYICTCRSCSAVYIDIQNSWMYQMRACYAGPFFFGSVVTWPINVPTDSTIKAPANWNKAHAGEIDSLPTWSWLLLHFQLQSDWVGFKNCFVAPNISRGRWFPTKSGPFWGTMSCGCHGFLPRLSLLLLRKSWQVNCMMVFGNSPKKAAGLGCEQNCVVPCTRFGFMFLLCLK